MAFSAGIKLGSYEIVALLGAGGMGEVYRARDSKLKREVAIKVLPDEFARDADRVARFQREAEVLASLNHPHISAIHGLGEFENFRFLVLELVEGETLAERITLGPIPVNEALVIAKQIGEALEAAHEKGIIHRDLKPANIKITPNGIVKVLDFGLAKVLDSEGTSGSLSNSPTMITAASVPGMIIGTIAYMPPEQAKGIEADRTSDMWAFGCVLYEMLTGRPVFEGETAGEILAGIFRGDPDWTRLPADTPVAIRRLLRRCLQKDRNWRLPTATDARIEIAEAHLEPDEPRRVEAPATRKPEQMLWIAAVLVLAMAAVIFSIPYFRAPAEALEMRLEVTTPTTTDPISLAISPDGRKLVYVAAGANGAPQLWLRSLDATAAQPLADTEGASYPFWSPDSQSIAFFSPGKLKRLDIGVGLQQTLANALLGRGGTWNTDGVILFTPGNGTPLYRVPASGGAAAVVTSLELRQDGSHRFPQFLPNGRQFLFYAQGLAETQGIYLGSLDSPETKRITAADTAALYMTTGWLLFVRQTTLQAQRFNISRSELGGNPVTIANGISPDPSAGAGGFSVSTTGLVAYRSGGASRRQLTWFDRSGTPTGTFGAPDENNLTAPALSPDGRLALAHRTMQNNTDIWMFDSTRTTRFTFDTSVDRFPIWSPDGSRFVFDSNRKSNRDLYGKSSDNAGVEEMLFESPEDKVPWDWSPDGKSLLYSVVSNSKKGSADLWVLPLDGDRKPHIFLATDAEERQAQFSRDGNWVAYESDESGKYQIYLRPFPGPGGQWQVSTSGGVQPRWRADGKELYYIAPDGKLMATSVTAKGAAFEPGTPVALFQTRIWGGGTNATNGLQYDVAPDGKFLINVVTEDAAASSITVLLNWTPQNK